LSEAQLRSGNTQGGLDILVLYGSWRRDVLTPDGVSEVCTALAARFLELHLGYRINRLIEEAVGTEEVAMHNAMNVWCQVPMLDEPDRPVRRLFVISKEEALTVAGSLANPLFHPREPVLGLRDADQQLLLAALSGPTDEELSSKVGLSLTGREKALEFHLRADD
jgi:hypothetical protein